MERMPFFDSSFQRQSRENISQHKLLLEVLRLRERRNAEILRNQPELGRYVQLTPSNAGGRLGRLAAFLKRNPHLVEDIHDYQPDHQDAIPILVVPRYPVILTRMGNEALACIPTLSCTYDAIKDLFRNDPSSYNIFNSSPDLISAMWDLAAEEPNTVIPYRRGSINPADYVAMAASGMLVNEVFRVPVRKLPGYSSR